ncbi:MAG: hypothetical protein K8F62_02260, partial [Pseudorhodoplanes sp.]|nr:hypothetical protein [Pseudorhodoplanes sp.]
HDRGHAIFSVKPRDIRPGTLSGTRHNGRPGADFVLVLRRSVGFTNNSTNSASPMRGHRPETDWLFDPKG